MKVPGLRSSYEKVGGVVFFGRMLDKIRLHAQGKLPADYQKNLGSGMDGRCVRFLQVKYEVVKQQALGGGSDEDVLEWCFTHGRRPNEEDLLAWNAFMSKRGWRDDASEWLKKIKTERGLSHRDDIQTVFDLIKTDEESD